MTLEKITKQNRSLIMEMKSLKNCIQKRNIKRISIKIREILKKYQIYIMK